MEYRIYKKEDFLSSTWSGGKTIQLDIFPRGSKYKERGFIWRLSTATCDLEESNFTSLPDYERVLMVLKGEAALVYEGERVARLRELEQDRFDGAYKTSCFGKITDYNLMVQKGNFGYMEVHKAQESKKLIIPEIHSEYEYISRGIYCIEDFIIVSINEETVMLRPGEQLVVTQKNDEAVAIGIMGYGVAITSNIYFNYDGRSENDTEMHGESIEQSSETKDRRDNCFYDDIKLTYMVAFSRFRGSKYILKGLKDVWFDKALQKGINRIDHAFIPFFLLLMGLAVFGICGVEWWGMDVGIGLMIGWLVLDTAIVTPLLFYISIPKPVRIHIKLIEQLNKEERELYKQQLGENKRLEKILKKYEISGRNKYID